ncbi:MAG: hypothetical protein GX649_00995 [Chloroflexi bacterium]|nr:hypothetical protein [Chloroflexota bacterium]
MRRGIGAVVVLVALAAAACVPAPSVSPTVTPIPPLTRAGASVSPSVPAPLPTTPAPAAVPGPTVDLEATVRSPQGPIHLLREAAIERAERIDVLDRTPTGHYALRLRIDEPEALRRIVESLSQPLAPADVPEGAAERRLRWVLPDGEAVVWEHGAGRMWGAQGYFRGQAVTAPAEFERLLAERLESASAVEAVARVRTWSERYRVSLTYPEHWQVVPGYDGHRVGGADGFLQLDVANAPEGGIDALAAGAAAHRLQPYGSSPTIEHLVVAGRAARLIVPSDDQPAEMADEAQLIVSYPEPVHVGDASYAYLVIYGDLAHLRELLQTLCFSETEPAG